MGHIRFLNTPNKRVTNEESKDAGRGMYALLDKDINETRMYTSLKKRYKNTGGPIKKKRYTS